MMVPSARATATSKHLMYFIKEILFLDVTRTKQAPPAASPYGRISGRADIAMGDSKRILCSTRDRRKKPIGQRYHDMRHYGCAKYLTSIPANAHAKYHGTASKASMRAEVTMRSLKRAAEAASRKRAAAPRRAMPHSQATTVAEGLFGLVLTARAFTSSGERQYRPAPHLPFSPLIGAAADVTPTLPPRLASQVSPHAYATWTEDGASLVAELLTMPARRAFTAAAASAKAVVPQRRISPPPNGRHKTRPRRRHGRLPLAEAAARQRHRKHVIPRHESALGRRACYMRSPSIAILQKCS